MVDIQARNVLSFRVYLSGFCHFFAKKKKEAKCFSPAFDVFGKRNVGEEKAALFVSIFKVLSQETSRQKRRGKSLGEEEGLCSLSQAQFRR